jgi:hypothetical protein
MKILFLLPALLAGATSLAQAQTAIQAGTVSLGGGIGYNRQTSESTFTTGSGVPITSKSTYNQFRIAPTAGYFVADNLAIGVNLGYSIRKNADTGADRRTTFQVGPYIQYYKMLSDQFGFLGTFGAGYQETGEPAPNISYRLNSSGFYAGITPGIVFFPVPKFGISASIGGLTYDRVKLEYDASTTERTENNFGANFGLDQLTFGGTFYFGR